MICGIIVDNIDNEEPPDKCQRCLVLGQNTTLKKNDLSRALFYIFEGLSLFIKNSKLVKLSIIPIFLTFIVLLMAYGSFLYFFISHISQYLPSKEGGEVFMNIARFTVTIFGSLLVAVLMVFLFLPVSSLICIPFNDLISVETESLLLGTQTQVRNEDFFYETKVGLKEVLKLLVFKLLILIIALPLNFIPVVGNILFLFIFSMVTAIDFLDIVMARKKYSLKEKFYFIKLNILPFIMFSIPFILLFWIPLIQILIIPCAAIGGTRFFLEAKKK